MKGKRSTTRPLDQMKNFGGFAETYRKRGISISVSSHGTKSVSVLLHTVGAIEYGPKEFFDVPRNPNLKWIWRGGE